MNKSTLKFDLELNENNIPKSIIMNSSDKQAENVNIKSVMISAFESSTKDTLRVDLWTPEMMVNEMFIMYHQTLISMANTLEKSTGNHELAEGLRDYCVFFAKQTNITQSK